jgi:hypothetical protein
MRKFISLIPVEFPRELEPQTNQLGKPEALNVLGCSLSGLIQAKPDGIGIDNFRLILEPPEGVRACHFHGAFPLWPHGIPRTAAQGV